MVGTKLFKENGNYKRGRKSMNRTFLKFPFIRSWSKATSDSMVNDFRYFKDKVKEVLKHRAIYKKSQVLKQILRHIFWILCEYCLCLLGFIIVPFITIFMTKWAVRKALISDEELDALEENGYPTEKQIKLKMLEKI